LIAASRGSASPTMLPQRYRYAMHSEHEHAQPARLGAVTSTGNGERVLEAYSAGDHVKHPKFGEGIVVSCEPSGQDYQVVVAFQGEAGIKKLLLSFAPLEKTGA